MTTDDLFLVASFIHDLNELARKSGSGFIHIDQAHNGMDDAFYSSRIVYIPRDDGKCDITYEMTIDENGAHCVMTYDDMFMSMYGMHVELDGIGKSLFIKVFAEDPEDKTFNMITVCKGRWHVM